MNISEVFYVGRLTLIFDPHFNSAKFQMPRLFFMVHHPSQCIEDGSPSFSLHF
jgi:hypothetical protein